MVLPNVLKEHHFQAGAVLDGRDVRVALWWDHCGECEGQGEARAMVSACARVGASAFPSATAHTSASAIPSAIANPSASANASMVLGPAAGSGAGPIASARATEIATGGRYREVRSPSRRGKSPRG